MGQVIKVDFSKPKIESGQSQTEAQIIGFNPQDAGRVFSRDEANERLKTVFAVTSRAQNKVEKLIAQLDNLDHGTQHEKASQLESEVNSLIQTWQDQVARLGARPKGLWIADFDSGSGYFCWKFPERSIDFHHSYTDGLSKRVKIGEETKFTSPEEKLRTFMLQKISETFGGIKR